MQIIVGGLADGPGYIITFEHGHVVIKPLPGWDHERFSELSAALNIIRQATKLKTPGLAEAAALSVMKFTQGQLGELVQGNAVLII